jgi:hypothetical protein
VDQPASGILSEWLIDFMVPRYPYGARLALAKCDPPI